MAELLEQQKIIVYENDHLDLKINLHQKNPDFLDRFIQKTVQSGFALSIPYEAAT